MESTQACYLQQGHHVDVMWWSYIWSWHDLLSHHTHPDVFCTFATLHWVKQGTSRGSAAMRCFEQSWHKQERNPCRHPQASGKSNALIKNSARTSHYWTGHTLPSEEALHDSQDLQQGAPQFGPQDSMDITGTASGKTNIKDIKSFLLSAISHVIANCNMFSGSNIMSDARW